MMGCTSKQWGDGDTIIEPMGAVAVLVGELYGRWLGFVLLFVLLVMLVSSN